MGAAPSASVLAISVASRTSRLLPMPAGPTMLNGAAEAVRGFLQDGGDCVEFALAANEFRFGAWTPAVLTDGEHAPRCDRSVRAFDVHKLTSAKMDSVLDQMRG